MRHTSEPIQGIEIIDVVPINPLISKCQIKVCYVSDKPNRNRSIITKEAAKKIAQSLPGCPIVGKYNEELQDFEEHNKFAVRGADGKLVLSSDTRPYGFVDLHAKVWFQSFLDDGMIEREYLCTEGWLWTAQYPEAQRVIDDGNGQSMELDEEKIDAHWTRDINGKPQFFIINEALITKLCLLGEDVEPCFEGASVTNFTLDEEFKTKLFTMMEQLKEMLGGTDVVEDNIIEETAAVSPEATVTEPEEPVVQVEEPVSQEILDNVDEPILQDNEEPVIENEPVAYNLEEIPEYIELQTSYSSLLEEHTQLQAQVAALIAERDSLQSAIEPLAQFKAAAVRREKEAMIASFYMLSNEDKRDVIDNIDSYSIDEIEAKLSIICVRNKVSFAQDIETEEQVTTFSLDNIPDDDATVPAWVKAAMEVAKTMN